MRENIVFLVFPKRKIFFLIKNIDKMYVMPSLVKWLQGKIQHNKKSEQILLIFNNPDTFYFFFSHSGSQPTFLHVSSPNK
jgi:hypothetical protein